MKLFALAASALALAASVVAQPEALRFGTVSINPTTVKPGQPFTVHYNGTYARHPPAFLDVYIQGIDYPNNFVQPQYLLQRTAFPPTNSVRDVTFNTVLPNQEWAQNANYTIWAFITYPIDTSTNPALEYGGTSTGIIIDQS